MASFARIDDNNIVIEVIAVDNKDIMVDGVENEQAGKDFIASIGLEGNWIQTSYNGNFRFKFAGIGMFYDAEHDEFVEILDNSFLPKPLANGNEIRTGDRKTLVIDGFPRSGNVYLSYLTAFAFEGNDIDQKLGFNQLHNLKTLTEGPSKFDLVIVPIRNPIDSIKSTIKMFEYDPNDFDSIFKLVSENLVWLQTVRENKDNLLIIDFNTLTQDPEIVINKISEHINVIPKIFDPQDVVDRINSDNLNIHLPNNVTSSASIEITDEEILAVLEQSTDIYNEIIG
jgi:hypothetical protein